MAPKPAANAKAADTKKDPKQLEVQRLAEEAKKLEEERKRQEELKKYEVFYYNDF